MLRRLFYGCIVLGIIGLAVFFFLTSPTTIAATDVPGSAGDVKKGEKLRLRYDVLIHESVQGDLDPGKLAERMRKGKN